MKGFTGIFILLLILRDVRSDKIVKTPWLPTHIQDTFFEAVTPVIDIAYKNLIRASLLCDSFISCFIFCQENDGTFSFWKIIADPFLGENAQGTTKKCWTRHPRGNFIPLLTGVTISGSSLHSSFPERMPTNLLNGVYNFQSLSSAHFRGPTSPYFLVDLGEKLFVRKINLHAPTGPAASTRFAQISVRLGNVAQTGDFSSYVQCGYFEGPDIPTGVFSIEVNLPLPYRFVSAQKYTLDEFMAIHLQIYTQTEEEYERARKYGY